MAIGRNSRTLLGDQGTDKLTVATAFTKLLATSNSMNSEVETTASEALTGSRFSSQEMVSAINGGGDTPLELTKEELKLILPYAGIEEGSTAGEFKVQNVITAWATIVKDIADENYYEEFVGCRINSLEITVAKGGYITANVSWLSLEDNHQTTAFSGTVADLTDKDDILKAFGTTVTLGATDITGDVDEFTLSINNNLKADDRGINDRYRRDLQAQGSEITMSIQSKFNKTTLNTLKTNLKDGTKTSVNVALAGGITFDMPRVAISNVVANVDSADQITASFDGKVKENSNGILNITFA